MIFTMSFDRSKLDPFGFVLPVEEGSHRGQIPRTFYRFAEASHPVKIEQAGGRNVVIGQLDLVGVFSILRSKPASHRWNGSTVKVAVIGGKDGTGGNKVEAILSYFNKEGWIRYVELPKDGGQHGGSIIEVQYRRLPKSEAGKKRRIKFVSGRGLVMFEEDGETEVKDAKSRQTFLVPDVDPEHPYGRDDEENEMNWMPYTRPSGERSSEERCSREPEPKERSTREVYKDHLDKDHEIEDTPSIPQAEPGEPESFGFERAEEDATEQVAVTSQNEFHTADSVPGDELSASELAAKLERLGKAASRSLEERMQYQNFLARDVRPRLADSPEPEKWTKPATRKWGENSIKAQIVLALCTDDSWPHTLLRSFGKQSGCYAAIDILEILMSFDWNSRKGISLETLIRSGKNQWNPEGWKAFKSRVCRNRDTNALTAKHAINLLRPVDGYSDYELAQRWIRDSASTTDPFLMGKPNTIQVFQWLYQIWRNGSYQTASSFEGSFEEVKDRYRGSLMSFIASSRTHLAVASSHHQSAGLIWGIEWERVRELHEEAIRSLNLRAEIFGLEPVESLFELIDLPLECEQPSVAGETERFAVLEPDVPEPDFCSRAFMPLVPLNPIEGGPDSIPLQKQTRLVKETQGVAESLLRYSRGEF